jgi:hypothetical protein
VRFPPHFLDRKQAPKGYGFGEKLFYSFGKAAVAGGFFAAIDRCTEGPKSVRWPGTSSGHPATGKVEIGIPQRAC